MQPFQVGDWTAYPHRDELEGPVERVRIEPRVMQVLVALADRPDEVVSREELLDKVWKDTFVSDEALTNAIRELRKALGDDVKSPRYIQTLPKKGYRLVAPVHMVKRRPGRMARIWLAFPALVLLLAVLWWVGTTSRPAANLPTITRVTTLEGEEVEPALSPDGTRIAFGRLERGGSMYRLYVASAGGGEPVAVSGGERANHPTWSPDGEWIAFLEYVEVEGSWPNELRVVRAGGGSERWIAVTRGWFATLDWSPDGNWLATDDRESDDEANAIYLHPVGPGVKRKLTSPPTSPENSSGDALPRFSPDGTLLAFVRGWHAPPNREDIYVQRVDGTGDAKRVTFLDGNILSYDWTPDGKGFVCAREDRLYYVPLESGTPVPLGFGEGARRVSISGDRLAYSVGSEDSDIWRIPGPAASSESESSRLVTSATWDVLPAYSPDGSRVLLTSTRTGKAQVWLCEASDPDGRCEQLTFFEDGASSGAWSPDGEQIAFEGRVAGEESELYVMHVETRRPERVTTDERIDAQPSWSRDGKTLYFTSRSGASESQLWKVSVETGEAARIGDVRGVRPRESPDGRFLYYATGTGFSRLARIPIEGGVEQIVVDREVPARSWDLWENKLVYSRQDAQRRYIDVLDLDTMETTRGDQPLEAMNYGLSVSPDGRWILLSHWDVSEIDIMLVDDFLAAIPR